MKPHLLCSNRCYVNTIIIYGGCGSRTMKRTSLFLVSFLALSSIGMAALGIHTLTGNPPPTGQSRWERSLELEATTLLNDPHYAQQFIRTGPAKLEYNCHGWTFTRGRRDMTCDEVIERLNSGRYRKVMIPLPGDIVIYYDKDNNLCHSGVVKATGLRGFVLVESKWGGAGRFLHLLTLPKVHARFDFYRRTFRSTDSLQLAQ